MRRGGSGGGGARGGARGDASGGGGARDERARGAPPENQSATLASARRQPNAADSPRVLRVVLSGAESTGKTELAQRLAAHFGVPWSEEHARRYFAARQAEGHDALTAADVDPIARGQIALEDAALGDATRLAIHDTDLVSTVVYARHYYGSCPGWIERAARERRAGLYLLCGTDVAWSPDPQRDRPEARSAIQTMLREELATLAARVVEVRGTREARFGIARDAIERAMQGR